MRLSILSTLAVFGSLAAAALPATDVVKNIQTLTTKSKNLQTPATQLTLLNAPLLLIGSGPWPAVITGFADIVFTATTVIGAMDAAGPASYAGADALAIGDAFRTFVRVHQDLLNILIGKTGFLTQIPFVGPPVAAVLRQIEAVVDTIAFALIDGVEASVASIMRSDLAALDGTINGAITLFSV